MKRTAKTYERIYSLGLRSRPVAVTPRWSKTYLQIDKFRFTCRAVGPIVSVGRGAREVVFLPLFLGAGVLRLGFFSHSAIRFPLPIGGVRMEKRVGAQKTISATTEANKPRTSRIASGCVPFCAPREPTKILAGAKHWFGHFRLVPPAGFEPASVLGACLMGVRRAGQLDPSQWRLPISPRGQLARGDGQLTDATRRAGRAPTNHTVHANDAANSAICSKSGNGNNFFSKRPHDGRRLGVFCFHLNAISVAV